MTDDELMRLIAKGDDEAFDTLFRRHSARVLGYGRSILGSLSLAEDVSQDVWIKVVKMAPSYQTQNTFRAWVTTITRNSCLDILRARSTDVPLDNATADGLVDVERASIVEIMTAAADINAVRAAIAELPDSQRACLALWMTEELSYEEIARQLDLSLSSVKSLLFRARETLAARLRGAR